MKTAYIARQTMIALAVAAASMLPVGSQAASTYTNSQFASIPMNLTSNDAIPLVMLNMSRDHQLSYKAYTDYADLNGDGTPETTYTDTIEYYGYFDSAKCYTYNTSDGRFNPTGLAGGTNKHHCSGQWSGNFLNWATMTRMDVVRKLLYGGKRSTDTAVMTVLERQYLPTDAHSFAKYYGGNDIDKLTPFTGIPTTHPVGTSSSTVTIPNPVTGDAAPTRTFNTNLSVQFGDQIKVFVTGDEGNRWMMGGVSGISGSNVTITIRKGGSASSSYTTNYNTWTLRNLSRTGISLCNLTKGSTVSHDNTNPPIIRVASGNHALWNANEGYQCQWQEERSNQGGSYEGGFRSNGNWAYFSGLNASAEHPSQNNIGLGTGSAKGEYIVRVRVGVAGLLGQEKVKQYGTTASPIHKPIGLLQVYADQLYFGLMTGSYSKNVSGGVLRKNIKSFIDEINPVNGTFMTGANGIVHNMDRLRIHGYNYSGSYTSSPDNCYYQQIGFVLSGGSVGQGYPANQGNCSTWGNPMSEIYMESLRYLAGKTANTAFTSSLTKDQQLGLTTATWQDPIDQDNYCAPINILNFNASVSGYDDDQMTGWSDVCSTRTAKQLTDEVGVLENITTGGSTKWFIGTNGGAGSADNNKLCSGKGIGGGFGAFAGLCPEAPTQKGTYLMAGMAHYANTNRIRNDLTVPSFRAHSRDLMATTYGVAMATNVPKIEVNVGGKKVTILPAYRLDISGKYGGGTLVDFKIVEQRADYGKYYVNWEDSEMGGDYDMDMWGTIEYKVSGSDITITTTTVAASTSNPQGFGYIISGTDRDGAHFHSGIYRFNFTDPTGARGCSNCVANDLPTSQTYAAISTSDTKLLEDPLWYAAKWGGPLTSGNPSMKSDGSPANYFYAINPIQLETSLNKVFLDIVTRTASATSVAIASSNSGAGALYQAYYEPLRQDSANNEASWVGTVQAMWIDGYGYIREDNGTGVLGNYEDNKRVEFYHDDSTGQTRIRRYISTKNNQYTPHYMEGTVTAYTSATGTVTFTVNPINGMSGTSGATFNNWTITNLTSKESGSSSTSVRLESGGIKTFTMTPPFVPFNNGDTIRVEHDEYITDSVENLKTLWNARKQLSLITDADIVTQRSFATTANNGRFIKTWVDTNGDGIVDSGEFIDFAVGAPLPPGYLDVPLTSAPNIVNYIRGQEIPGFRSRKINYDGTGDQVMRLGDVVNSSPTVVGAPDKGYDLTYRDASYLEFRRKYAKRRQMVYVGANDGMLHAFNGGFYDAANSTFKTAGTDHNGIAATQHPLGSEIWSYVPMNLLPHLKWLTIPKGTNPDDPDYYGYQHVYYVDGNPKVFDVKIFNNDTDHPEGWGTILVVGMRFGGGPMTIDVGAGSSRTFRSAYVIMDITNPEIEPRLLAEIQVPDESYSISSPAIAIIKDKVVSNDDNKWFLAFGSGPTDLINASTNNNAHLFILDLAELSIPGSSAGTLPSMCTRDAINGGAMYIYSCDTGVGASMTGNPVVVDWDLRYKTDAIYFGTAGDAGGTSGRMMRMDINGSANPVNWSNPATLIDVGQPVTAFPNLGVDDNRPRNKWVFFGTGRFFVNPDLYSTTVQSIYGVIDDGSEVHKINLRNTSNAQVETDGTISGVGGFSSFNDMDANTGKGWYMNLPLIQGTTGTAPATRVVTNSVLAGGMLFTTAYQPSNDKCAGDGFSRLYGLYYKTGTAHPIYGLMNIIVVGGKKVNSSYVDLGAGFASAPVVVFNNADVTSGDFTIVYQKDGMPGSVPGGGPLPVRSGMESWRQRWQ